MTVALEGGRGEEVLRVWGRGRGGGSGSENTVHAALLTAEKRAQLLRQVVDSCVGPELLVCASDLQPVVRHVSPQDKHGGALQQDVASISLELVRLAHDADGEGREAGVDTGEGGGRVGGRGVGAAIAALLAADGEGAMGVSEASRFATQHGLVLTSRADVAAALASR